MIGNAGCGNGEKIEVCGCAGNTEVAVAPALDVTALGLERGWAAREGAAATPAKIDSVSAVRNRVIE
jgi:hypothetical protein